MFNKKYADRLVYWSGFRTSLETSATPVEDTIALFNAAPAELYAADPYDPSTWPDPWELIHENSFCPFVRILAICYTLQLTARFSNSNFEIHIIKDRSLSTTEYLLYVDDLILGTSQGKCVIKDKLSETAHSEYTHVMPLLH